MIAGRFGGRPTKLTEEIVIRLEDELFGNGFVVGEAAVAVNIHPNTLCNWFKRYPSLLHRLEDSYDKREKERERVEDPEAYERHKQMNAEIDAAKVAVDLR